MEHPDLFDSPEVQTRIDIADMLIYQGRVEALNLVLDDLDQLPKAPADFYAIRALVKARRDQDRTILRHMEDELE